MGLDWLAGNKPKPGFEAEFAKLRSQNDGGEPITDEMRERFDAVSICAYTQVGAPVVGTDRLADAWVLAHVRHQALHDSGEDHDHEAAQEIDFDDPAASVAGNDDERAALEQMKGYHVLDLAPPCDGLPVYTHGAVSDEVDLTSFRGKFLDDCAEILGEELMERAFTDQSPEELVEFGTALIQHGRRVAAEHGCEAIEQQVEPPDELESPAGQAHILFSAGRWCLYWGSRGHYLEASF
jgi:hypothetical protein